MMKIYGEKMNNDATVRVLEPNYSSALLFALMVSSGKAAIHKHLSMMPSTGWKAYFELASIMRRRFLTIRAVVRCRSKLMRGSLSTGFSICSGFWALKVRSWM